VRLQRTLVTGTLVLALGGVSTVLAACGDDGESDYVTTSVTEDCDVEDQRNYEDDCGYWESADGTEQRFGAQPGVTWIWIWWTWVQVGRSSTAPAGWRSPSHLKVKAPTKTVRVPRKSCALGVTDVPVNLLDGRRPAGGIAPPPARPAPPPAPRINNPPPPRPQPGGNVNPNPPPRPQPPVYRPPAKVAC